MSSVVPLKPRRGKNKPPLQRPEDLNAIDQAIGELFIRLAAKHGINAVVMVAFRFCAQAIAVAKNKNLPTETAWLETLRKIFDKAMQGGQV